MSTEPTAGPREPSHRATGLGSMPGTDVGEAARTIVGELPGLPHLPELPARGVGADMIGRTAALLVDLAVDVRPSGYRVAPRAGADQRRAVDLLARDADALDEALGRAGVTPPAVKTQVTGPWTLASGIELRSGHRVLTDRGAVAEFTESLIEGLRGHVAKLRDRTGAPVTVQIDEPGLPAVLAGSLSTPSGYGTVAAVPGAEIRSGLAALVDAAHGVGATAVVHCCHPSAPLALLGAVGADAVALDLLALGSGSTVLDALGELWEAVPLWLGVVPSGDRPAPGDRPVPNDQPAAPVLSEEAGEGGADGADAVDPSLLELARPALSLTDRLGFDRSRLADRAVVTPSCGLAGASPTWAKRALGRSVELAEAFADPPASW